MRWIALVLVAGISINSPADTGAIKTHLLCTTIHHAIGDKPADVLYKIGAADNISEREVTTPHAKDRKDKEVILRYSDGHILFHHLTDKNIYILLTAKLSRKHFNGNLNNSIPEKLGDIIYRYGPPDKEIDGGVRYLCTFEGIEWFDVHHQDSKVTGISYTGYLD